MGVPWRPGWPVFMNMHGCLLSIVQYALPGCVCFGERLAGVCIYLFPDSPPALCTSLSVSLNPSLSCMLVNACSLLLLLPPRYKFAISSTKHKPLPIHPAPPIAAPNTPWRRQTLSLHLARQHWMGWQLSWGPPPQLSSRRMRLLRRGGTVGLGGLVVSALRLGCWLLSKRRLQKQRLQPHVQEHRVISSRSAHMPLQHSIQYACKQQQAICCMRSCLSFAVDAPFATCLPFPNRSELASLSQRLDAAAHVSYTAAKQQLVEEGEAAGARRRHGDAACTLHVA